MNIVASVAAGLYALNLCLFLGFHALARHHDILSHPVSNYGTDALTTTLFKIYCIIGSIGAVLLAWLFYSSPPGVAFRPDIPVALLAMAVCRLGIAFVPTDGINAPASTRGKIHLVLAVTAFTLVTMVIARATGTLASDPHLPALHVMWPALYWAVALSLAAVVVTFPSPLRAVFGLAERAFICSSAVWFLLAAIWFAVPRAA